MIKSKVIELVEGAAADVVGISCHAVDKWPEVLPDRIADQVMEAVARQRFPDLINASPEHPEAKVV